MVPGPDCMGDGRICPNGINHEALGCVMNYLAGKRHADDEDLQHALVDWLNSQAAVWYEEGISKLVSRYDKCLNVQGDYAEK